MLKTLDDEEASLREALKNSQMTIHAADQKEKELKDKLKMHTKRQNELDCRYKEVLAAKEEREMQSVMLEEGKVRLGSCCFLSTFCKSIFYFYIRLRWKIE